MARLKPLTTDAPPLPFIDLQAQLAVSERLSRSVLSLPMHPYLERETQDRIVAAFVDAVSE